MPGALPLENVPVRMWLLFTRVSHVVPSGYDELQWRPIRFDRHKRSCERRTLAPDSLQPRTKSEEKLQNTSWERNHNEVIGSGVSMAPYHACCHSARSHLRAVTASPGCPLLILELLHERLVLLLQLQVPAREGVVLQALANGVGAVLAAEQIVFGLRLSFAPGEARRD